MPAFFLTYFPSRRTARLSARPLPASTRLSARVSVTRSRPTLLARSTCPSTSAPRRYVVPDVAAAAAAGLVWRPPSDTVCPALPATSSHWLLPAPAPQTRAIRKSLTKHEKSLRTERQKKKAIHFPKRVYALKA